MGTQIYCIFRENHFFLIIKFDQKITKQNLHLAISFNQNQIKRQRDYVTSAKRWISLILMPLFFNPLFLHSCCNSGTVRLLKRASSYSAILNFSHFLRYSFCDLLPWILAKLLRVESSRWIARKINTHLVGFIDVLWSNQIW